MIENCLDNHPSISKFLRAHMINWIFHVCKVLKKEDKSLPFCCINLMDRYM